MAKKSQNRLRPENCNKAMCKTCIFQTNGNQVQLSQERYDEITGYLASGKSSHICHTTNLTCYGALQFQAKIFHAMHIIPEPTAESLLATAQQFIK